MAGKDSSQDVRSLSGQTEPTQPRSTASSRRGSTVSRSQSSSTIFTGNTSNTGSTPLPSPTMLRKASSSSLQPSASPALGTSPRTSRNTSPIRKDRPIAAVNSAAGPPSAAAIQRALSSSSVPQLAQSQSTVEAVSNVRKSRGGLESSLQWPISPRLRSPPPSNPTSKRTSNTAQKRSDAAASINSAINSTSSQATALQSKATSEGDAPAAPTKTPARANTARPALETVQETSHDTNVEPSAAVLQASADLKPLTRLSEDPTSTAKRDVAGGPEGDKPAESGNESTGNKSDGTTRGRRASTSSTATSHTAQKPSRPNTKTAYPLSSAKTRPAEGKQNMTVETETVQSIPQSGFAAADRSVRRTEGGSLRLMPSNETIRPRKERKKVERKTRSINQGTATSKADLFEARVASAVDEVSSSDSDETFVYESNPPEPPRHRQRHHSRTPSVTSSHSIADHASRTALRAYASTASTTDRGSDENSIRHPHRLGGKRSMKFSSNAYVHDPEDNDGNSNFTSPAGNGTVRAHTPRHIGRFGRNAAGTNYDAHDTHSNKPRHLSAPHVRSSPHYHHGSVHYRSPSSNNPSSATFFSRKQEPPYDFDAEANADDETMPLLLRGNRPRTASRRLVSDGRGFPGEQSGMAYHQRRRCNGRLGACIFTMIFVLAVIASAVVFVFTSSRPLESVEITKIQHVVASEQELLLDLSIVGTNANSLTISVSEVDLDVFARSKIGFLGDPPASEGPSYSSGVQVSRLAKKDDEDYSDPNPAQDPSSGHWTTPADSQTPGHDHGTDPLPPDAEERQTLFLSRIFHLDQPLVFEPSGPFGRVERRLMTSLRVSHPGNKTESGGSRKWERVLGSGEEWELIVKGTLKYELPVTRRVGSVSVGGAVMVEGGGDTGDDGKLKEL